MSILWLMTYTMILNQSLPFAQCAMEEIKVPLLNNMEDCSVMEHFYVRFLV